MGEAFLGNNPQDMQDLVTKIKHAVDSINQAISQLDGKVSSVQWNGPDATKFKTSDWPSHKGNLSKIVTDLEQVAQVVTKQKEQQEQTSAN